MIWEGGESALIQAELAIPFGSTNLMLEHINKIIIQVGPSHHEKFKRHLSLQSSSMQPMAFMQPNPKEILKMK